MPRFLDRRYGVPKYLKEEWGVTYTFGTLTKLATTGGGPEYALIGGRAFYTPDSIDKWIEAKMQVRGNTSESPNVRAATQHPPKSEAA